MSHDCHMTSLNRTTPSYTPSPPLHTFRRLSDADKDDLLSFSDFVVAVHLVNLALKGVVAVLNHWVHCGPGLGTHTHTHMQHLALVSWQVTSCWARQMGWMSPTDKPAAKSLTSLAFACARCLQSGPQYVWCCCELELTGCVHQAAHV